MDLRPELRTLSLCSGYGGLDLGVWLATGGASRVVCNVEREAFTAACLVAQAEARTVAPAPVWTDLSTLDAGAWRGRVDLVTGGIPCQPWSCAGKGLGLEDERWIWPDVARLLRALRPRLLFLEEVPGFAAGGLEHVLGTLAEGGWAAEWDCFRASQVGAPHRRERLFVLAHRDGWGCQEQRSGGLLDGQRAARGDDVDGCLQGVAQPDGLGHERPWQARGRGSGPAISGGELGDPLRQRPQGRIEDGDSQALQPGGGRGGARFPPGPSDRDAWARVLARDPGLAPAKPSVCGMADGPASELDIAEHAYRSLRLRALGNGVVPGQAALAWRVLSARLGI